MRTLAHVLALLVAFGLATAWAGWWTVPIVAALWAFARPGAGRPGVTAGAVAAAAWAALLVGTGPEALGPLARVLGGIVGTSAAVAIAITLIFPATLAASAASLVAALRPEAER